MLMSDAFAIGFAVAYVGRSGAASSRLQTLKSIAEVRRRSDSDARPQAARLLAQRRGCCMARSTCAQGQEATTPGDIQQCVSICCPLPIFETTDYGRHAVSRIHRFFDTSYSGARMRPASIPLA